MEFNFDFMLVALKAAIKFLPVSLVLAFIPLLVGIVLGTFIAIARVFKVKVLWKVCQIYVVIIKGIPVVLLLLIMYFGLIQGFDGLAVLFHLRIRSKDINLIYIAIIAFSINAIATISEIIRGGLMSVDKGQYEASYSVGMTKTQTLWRIVLPQIFPVAVPMLCNSFIGLFKGSSVAFLISVTDVMNGALITATGNYLFLEAYVAAAIVYWVVCIIIERGSCILENHLKKYSRGVAL
ncbi:amino acid ABC transporter permease [Clostridium estertheticum]|uniref:Amino acid ABC transporter permease n=1 Tax=Clostridium estertheticum TaxID=238834 RepID=A0AA47I7X2_9CLOT|nr:amino acid ABC transporter permease [Clostridium estertheticum]MBU3154533.1 amino acid ABC transporter permease [Clostridium estertheticum]MBU3201253.1 amino acid ABC transporter permease [Clostridium estertheticum]WAG62033.1 amino acid ABC transporter permease [Clostridium estertheticum]WAG63843.1 amino acid ABC transporter permease [Clostridium estertheticum]